jgi:hypothetical protein
MRNKTAKMLRHMANTENLDLSKDVDNNPQLRTTYTKTNICKKQFTMINPTSVEPLIIPYTTCTYTLNKDCTRYAYKQMKKEYINGK